MNRESVEESLSLEDFHPFRIVTSAGIAYDITHPLNVALGKTEMFYYFPKSDRSVRIPYTHIATIDTSSTKSK